MEVLLIGFTVFALMLSGGGAGPAPAPEQAIEETYEDATVKEVEPETEPELRLEDILTSEPNVTPATPLLTSLSVREQKAPIAVYAIEDKTGQYTDVGSSVVSQGATEMLITALVRSGQFTVLDRVEFQSLMNEQNLETSGRLAPGTGPVIGNLTGAKYVIDGAVTGYQVDRNTGGFGLAIGGKGGSTQVARAVAAVDLRITDTSTGEVIWADSLKKEIVGQRLSLTLFSFMGNNIVEFETGRGKQQVINLVIRTLLEEAVYKLATDLDF